MFTTEYFGLYVQATPPAPTLTGGEVVPVIISGVTNHTTTAQIAELTGIGKTLTPYVWHEENQAADVATFTLATPAQNCVGILTADIWSISSGTGTGDPTLLISWTEPDGSAGTLTLDAQFPGPSQGGVVSAGIEILAGTPITVSVTGGAPYGTSLWGADVALLTFQ
jgi:hypothetical protein